MEKVKLGEIFKYLPKSKFKAGEGKEEGLYKFFTSSNIQNKYVDEFIYNGEYLIFGTGGKASINYCNEKFSTSTDNFVVKVSEKFCTKLIYLYFKNNMEKLEKGFKGASIKHISKEYINQLTIPKYDFQIQLDIVTKLDKMQEIIDIRKKQIEQLDELIKSQFVEKFENKNYSFEKIENVAQDVFAGGDKPNDISKEINKIYKYPVFANGYENNGLQGYSKEYRVDSDAITISARGTIGYSIIRKKEFTPIVRLITIIPNKKVNLIYLKYAIDNIKISSSGTSQAQLTVPLIKAERIILPPIDLQNQFADIVKKIEEQKLKLQKSLEEMEKLQESLMNKYFN